MPPRRIAYTFVSRRRRPAPYPPPPPPNPRRIAYKFVSRRPAPQPRPPPLPSYARRTVFKFAPRRPPPPPPLPPTPNQRLIDLQRRLSDAEQIHVDWIDYADRVGWNPGFRKLETDLINQQYGLKRQIAEAQQSIRAPYKMTRDDYLRWKDPEPFAIPWRQELRQRLVHKTHPRGYVPKPAFVPPKKKPTFRIMTHSRPFNPPRRRTGETCIGCMKDISNCNC